jgi:hypothetical protein
MATSENNFLLHKVRGQLGKQIVVKHYGDKIVISAYPDMTRVKPSVKQKKRRALFSEGVVYAKAIIADPELNELYKAEVKKEGLFTILPLRNFWMRLRSEVHGL